MIFSYFPWDAWCLSIVDYESTLGNGIYMDYFLDIAIV